MDEHNNINNGYVGINNTVHQPESLDSNPPVPLDTNLHTQSHIQSFRPYATSFSLEDMPYINTNPPSQTTVNLPQPIQHVRTPDIFLPFSGSVDMTSINTVDYRNAGNRTTSYQADPSDSYYHPGVGIRLTEQDMNCRCPLCGSSNGHFDTIDSQFVTYTLAPMRAQASDNTNLFNETASLEYVVIREVRVQSVLGRVPAASIGEMSALTQM
ncbi:5117_t:CDS:2 [Paraglomus occultum]|uniref:5117_t:CDS:1 n=1 Tax=Paraglomus occultum TaxID=144539 RepID=A0A9N9AWA8_9GLOM|nr:5117_t:CDS:2 [Paraglomus occultum]